jgi:hypothetical protein
MIRPLAATRMSAALFLLAALAACAHTAQVARTPLTMAQLSNLVTGNTLHVVEASDASAAMSAEPCAPATRHCAPRRVTTIYLAPDGTGWIDEQARRGIAPWTGTMAMITAWGMAPPSTLCLTAAPLIGDMPSFSPARHECVAIARSGAAQGAPLVAAVAQGRDSWVGVVTARAGNEFPPALTSQYIDMVKVLYGGQIPSWTAK